MRFELDLNGSQLPLPWEEEKENAGRTNSIESAPLHFEICDAISAIAFITALRTPGS
jgi:hypothetical protein